MGVSPLEQLDKAIEYFQAKLTKQQKQEHDRTRCIVKSERAFRRREERLRDEKIALLEGILGWRDEFVEYERFAKLFGENHEFVIIYDGGWGHRVDSGYGGCWSRIILEDTGKLEYKAGYKMWSSGPCFPLTRAAARKLTAHYLKQLYEHVYSGRVYGQIARELRERPVW